MASVVAVESTKKIITVFQPDQQKKHGRAIDADVLFVATGSDLYEIKK